MAFWNADPKLKPYRRQHGYAVLRRLQGADHAGIGAVAANYTLVDMFASVATGNATPEAAVKQAAQAGRALSQEADARPGSAPAMRRAPRLQATRAGWMDNHRRMWPERLTARRKPDWLVRLFDYKPFLVTLCMLPTVGLLLVFLTYPLGLGLWLSLTDTTIGQPGELHRAGELRLPVRRSGVLGRGRSTRSSTRPSRRPGNSLLGLWLALLLNHHLPFKAFIRAIVLLPWIVPTVLSAIAWWWIYDPQFSIISYVLVDVLHLRDTLHRLPRLALARPLVADRRQHLARHPVRGDHACWPGCRPSRRRCTRRRCWTAPSAGRSSAASPCRC